MKQTKRQHFRKLLGFSFLLCMLPVILVGFFSYYKASSIIQEKVNESSIQVLEQTRMQVEQKLLSIDSAVTQFALSPLVTEMLKQLYDPKEYAIFRQLETEMHTLQSFPFFLSDVYFVNFNRNWMRSNSGFFELSSHRDVKRVQELLRRGKSSYWTHEIERDERSGVPSNSYMTLVKKLPANTLNPSGLILARIPSFKLSDAITSSEKQGHHLIVDEDGSLLIKDEEFPSEWLTDSLAISLGGLEESKGILYLELNNEKVDISYVQSPYNKWVYVSIVSLDEIKKVSNSIKWFTLLICSLILCFMLIIAYQGTSKIYSPIRRVYENLLYKTDQDDVRQGDEFHFIGERISHLLQSETRMVTELQSHLRHLKPTFMLRLILGEIQEQDVPAQLNKFGFQADWSWIYVMAIEIDSLKDSKYEEKDHDLLLYAINNVLSELIPAEQRLEPISIGEAQVCVIGGNQPSAEAFKNETSKLAEQIQSVIQNYLSLQVSIGFSRVFHNLGFLPKAYEEAEEALKSRIRLGNEMIVFLEDAEPDFRRNWMFPELLKDELTACIKAGDIEGAQNVLHQFMSAVYQSELRADDCQFVFIRLLIELMKVIQDNGMSLDAFQQHESSLFDQLLALRTPREIESWFWDMIILPATNLLAEKRDSRFRTISSGVIHMIHHDYDKDLSLETCAAALNYHPNYLKRVFRNETGVNFSDYLAQYRLRMAKQLLCETDMKVSEIAEKLRYNNPQNFIRSFKKMEDMTPGQYRDKHGNHSSD